jgi:hypothetical protein
MSQPPMVTLGTKADAAKAISPRLVAPDTDNVNRNPLRHLSDRPLAIVDPNLVLNAMLLDEEAYVIHAVPGRFAVDPHAAQMILAAALLFDTVYSLPVLATDTAGCDDFLGLGFSRLFRGTLVKLQDSGFINFGLEGLVPRDRKAEMDAAIAFLDRVHAAENQARTLVGTPPDVWLGALETNLALGRCTGVPVFTSSFPIVSPHSHVENPHQSCSPLQILQSVLSFEVPVLEVDSLDDILRIRNTSGAQDFRRVIYSMWNQVRMTPGNDEQRATRALRLWTDMRSEALHLIASEFGPRVTAWNVVKGGLCLMLDLAGFVPGFSALGASIGAAKDMANLRSLLRRKSLAQNLAAFAFVADIRGGNR